MPIFITFLPGLGEVSDRFRDPDGSRPRPRPRPGGLGLETETRDLTKGLETGLETETETRDLQHWRSGPCKSSWFNEKPL